MHIARSICYINSIIFTGEDVMMECVVQSIPLPSIEWFKIVPKGSSRDNNNTSIITTGGVTHQHNYQENNNNGQKTMINNGYNINSLPEYEYKHLSHKTMIPNGHNEVLITNMSLMSFGRQMYVIKEEIKNAGQVKSSKLIIINPLPKDSGR